MLLDLRNYADLLLCLGNRISLFLHVSQCFHLLLDLRDCTDLLLRFGNSVNLFLYIRKCFNSFLHFGNSFCQALNIRYGTDCFHLVSDFFNRVDLLLHRFLLCGNFFNTILHRGNRCNLLLHIGDRFNGIAKRGCCFDFLLQFSQIIVERSNRITVHRSSLRSL